MLDQTSQWYKLQYPECFVNEELRMMQKTLADFVDNEIMPQHWSLYRLVKYVCGR